jgi:hypothetical protein
MFRSKQKPIIRTIKRGVSVFKINKLTPRDIVKRLSRRLKFRIEDLYNTHICAFFMCHKNAILQHDIEFYNNCLNDINVTKKEHPWVIAVGFEHAWCQIFRLP